MYSAKVSVWIAKTEGDRAFVESLGGVFDSVLTGDSISTGGPCPCGQYLEERDCVEKSMIDFCHFI